MEDEGFFVCSAFSVAGSIATKAYLEVTALADEPPPIIDIGPANQTLPVNTLAILPCEASGNMLLEYYFSDKVISSVSFSFEFNSQNLLNFG